MASMALEGRRRYAGFLAVPGTMATSVGGPRCRWGRNAGDPLVLQRHSALVGEACFARVKSARSGCPPPEGSPTFTERTRRQRQRTGSAAAGAR